MLGITLPRESQVRQWLAHYGVPAVGIGLVAGNKATAINVYGELSKEITAPPDTVWGSKALADALKVFGGDEVEPAPLSQLFTRLNMPDTFVGDPVVILNRLARPHNKRQGIYVFKPYDTEDHLFTTLHDICRLFVHLHQHPEWITTQQSYGWQLESDLNNALFHRATGEGASHTLLLLPQTQQALAIFTNSDNGDRVEECILNSMGMDVSLVSSKV